MPKLPQPRPPDEPRPLIEAMPHLSAPIDEHRVLPYPPRPWWERMALVLVAVAGALALLAYAFMRASALR